MVVGEKLYTVWLRGMQLWWGLSVWLKIPLIFGVSRVFAWCLFTVVGRQQVVSPWGSGPTSYLSFISFWDAGWYEQIAASGYPEVLPRDSNGNVAENTWAFYPLFPYTAHLLGQVFHLDYYLAAALVALLAGFAAAYLIFLLFRESLLAVSSDRETSHHEHLALWGLAAVSFMPVAPVLQVPYAESYNLLFLSATLLLLVRRRWGWAVATGILACLSRPVGVPLGAAAGMWWLVSFCAQYRQFRVGRGLKDAFLLAGRKTAGQLVSALAICASALIWPALAWYRTGEMDAYTATETAWRGTHLAPVMPWIKQAELYFGGWGLLLLVVVVAALACILATSSVRKTLHPVLIIWAASYSLYLLIFLNPQSSLFRLLLPLFVLYLPLVAVSGSRAYRGLLLISGAALQCGWVGWLWHWKQLPGGGDYPP